MASGTDPMAEHVWSVLCDRLIIDRDSNNVSLDVLEQMNLEGGPPINLGEAAIVPYRMTLASLWTRDDPAVGERIRGRARILDPNHQQRVELIFDVDLTTHRRLRSRCNLNGLPITVSGVYRFVVEAERADDEWEQVASIPLDVVLPTPPVSDPEPKTVN